MALRPRQVVEMFHLVFLRALLAKGDDKARIALKGGCNLRFYFGSVRYSEDLDLDVNGLPRETLRNKVDRLLQSPLVTSVLRTQGIELVEVSSPKQTDTTQRWKVGLRGASLGVPLRTKMEFSRRQRVEGTVFDATSREVVQPYGLAPFMASHYAAHAAIVQKVHALAGRAEPQARDVFDLSLLFARADTAGLTMTPAQKGWLQQAIEQAVSISFDAYTSKVVAFLDPVQADLHRSRHAWDAMQGSVITRLQELS